MKSVKCDAWSAKCEVWSSFQACFRLVSGSFQSCRSDFRFMLDWKVFCALQSRIGKCFVQDFVVPRSIGRYFVVQVALGSVECIVKKRVWSVEFGVESVECRV